MNKSEYDRIQADLTTLMDTDRMKSKYLNAKERDAYKLAVKACKSVLSNHNPSKTSTEDGDW